MQRILNNPDDIVDEMLEGFLKTHSDLVEMGSNPRVVKTKHIPANKVAVITGGGSGHKPAFIGYVGRNLCDAAAVGEICSSPTAAAFLDAAKDTDQGRGVACLYGNYSGDNMNVKMAVKMAEKQGIIVKTVVANDDVASAPKDQREKRRGVAGEVLMWKVGGAKAAQGASLDEVVAAAQKAIDNTRSVGIGLSPCTLPAVGHPNFEIKPGTMEVGIGHHGEPGIAVTELESAAQMAKRMVDVVVPDLPFENGDEVVVLVSGLGATPVMELYVLYNEIEKLLKEKGIRIHRPYVGNYFTSLEMMGATLTVMKVDDELKQLIDLPCDSMGLKQVGDMEPDRDFADPAAPVHREEKTEADFETPVRRNVDQPKVQKKRPQNGTGMKNSDGKPVLLGMVKAIQENKDYLAEVDGLIGDGDHGMNMNKGFTLFEKRFGDKAFTLTEGLDKLGDILFSEIGGSMGPIYGTILKEMALAGADLDEITLADFAEMLSAGLKGLQEIVQAQVGDKTLVDTLSPAVDVLKKRAEQDAAFAMALEEMKQAAAAGRDSTKDMVAKFGRSSRLGERSRGVLDAGATSCCIILTAMADEMIAQIQ
ncbi:MAG: dihydroxyacetone kinase subunit L [Blautia sp.]|nr:dihydroxyacetone kinase subunit L [Blautia sp.]